MSQRLDGGYGWAIVFAQFIVTTLILGTTKASGVWFVYFRSEYEETYAVTSTISLVQRICECSTALVFSFLAERYGSRPIMLAGSAVVVASAIGSVFADSILDLTITFGALGGLGAAMLSYPGGQMLPKYFDKKIAIASALSLSGVSFGPMFFPFMIEYSVMQYGLSGSFFVLAGAYVHIFIAAFLMRPASFFQPKGDDVQRPSFHSTLQKFKKCFRCKALYFYYFAYAGLQASLANVISYQQAHAKDVGVTDPTLLASLTFIMGVCEILSRIAFSLILHFVPSVRPYRIHEIASAVFVVVLCLYPFFSNYWLIATCSGVIGVVGSALGVPLMPTLRAIVGLDLAAPAFGLICAPVMLSYLTVLLCGFIRDYTGSFIAVFYGCAALSLAGAAAIEAVAWLNKDWLYNKLSSSLFHS